MNNVMPAPGRIDPCHVFDFDIFGDPRMDSDVQGAYARVLRDAPDVFYTPRNGGHWVVRRFEPIAELLQDYDHFSAREMRIPRVADTPFLLPLMADPPHSAPYRLAMMRTFSRSGVHRLETKVEHWASAIVDEVAERGECDFVEDVATLFPVSIFMELMGLPMERLREFRALSAGFFKAREPAALRQVSEKIFAILRTHIEQRRAAPADDLVSELLAAQVEGRTMSAEEVMAMCFLLFLGGMDTVTNLTSFAFRSLAKDPELQARLAADPDLIPAFVDESLRCFPVVNPARLVIRDCDRFGVRMQAGDMVICLLSEAGRDERVNRDPARFDLDRSDALHLTFATGPHFCIGHLLARLELQILTHAWLQRVPRFTTEPDAPGRFRMGPMLALDSLPLVWDASIQGPQIQRH